MNCRIKFELARPTVGRPVQIVSYNSLSVYNSLLAAIYLYMILPIKTYKPKFEQKYKLKYLVSILRRFKRKMRASSSSNEF